ncbi:hypothetical protein BO83DRAFT_192297 [Aspergillus eucalypticola CBS 122712]|uniref:Uncharacterized protein n=1 Tax=Aspergillus eucalypticola (strain CBS 122712 / IBT 29274) TaxID=1448314 RepID=A0A317ULT7_ASPEC|nr:uncharacterized protein BO83DRAFT_192297 [Aspergillus eucalypticola CBS 122712]PWY62359.1 hypothetical protein BO83DRAFT_192297 [Aspergillus eucalypticola CBS 122712]
MWLLIRGYFGAGIVCGIVGFYVNDADHRVSCRCWGDEDGGLTVLCIWFPKECGLTGISIDIHRSQRCTLASTT